MLVENVADYKARTLIGDVPATCMQTAHMHGIDILLN